MVIRLHANATTSPKVRREIQRAPASVTDRKLAIRHGVSVDTIRRWRERNGVEDPSHTPHSLPTTLTSEQEVVVVEHRRMLLLPLDGLPAV